MQRACAGLYCHLRPVWLWHIFPLQILIDTISWIKLLNTKHVLRVSLQLLSETFLILRRRERDTNINIDMSSYKVLVILVRFKWNLNLLDIFSKNVQIQSNLGSRTPRIMNNSVYEQIFRTQSFSDDVLCLELRTRKPSTLWEKRQKKEKESPSKQ